MFLPCSFVPFVLLKLPFPRVHRFRGTKGRRIFMEGGEKNVPDANHGQKFYDRAAVINYPWAKGRLVCRAFDITTGRV